MKNLSRLLVLSLAVVSLPSFSCTKDGLEGFVPENNLKILVGEKAAGGISEAQFNSVIDRVEAMYSPIVTQHGGNLTVERKWKDGTVNAYAEQTGKEWKVSMFGGLARHRTITEDGMALVICHELGHHLAGAPRYSDDEWASNEGQSDYFATTKCLRRVWENDNNEEIISKMELPASLIEACEKNWSEATDRAICKRAGMSGMSVANLFAALGWSKVPKFETPDQKIVTVTNDAHPAAQCRLDTYFQGSLCEVPFTSDFDHSSEVTGACHASTGQSIGLRPLCWFKPSL